MRAAERMKVLIKDLLLFSRIGKHREIALIDLNELLQEVVLVVDLDNCFYPRHLATTAVLVWPMLVRYRRLK